MNKQNMACICTTEKFKPSRRTTHAICGKMHASRENSIELNQSQKDKYCIFSTIFGSSISCGNKNMHIHDMKVDMKLSEENGRLMRGVRK